MLIRDCRHGFALSWDQWPILVLRDVSLRSLSWVPAGLWGGGGGGALAALLAAGVQHGVGALDVVDLT